MPFSFVLRFAGCIALASLSPVLLAQWTATILHPSGFEWSEGYGGYSNKQVGRAVTAGGASRAGLWTGTAATWVNLHPAGASESFAFDGAGTKQSGFVIISGAERAALWSGTAASFVNLHPAAAIESYVVAIDTATQAGYVNIAGVERACLWSGTAASFVDLHPTGASESVARNVLGAKQVGYAVYAGNAHAALWTGTAASFVDLHPAGAVDSVINVLTATKQGGYASFGDEPHAGMWSGTAGSFIDLHPGDYPESYLSDMTDSIQAGSFTEGEDRRACYWTGTAGSMVNLHALLPAGYKASVAHGISTDGSFIYITGVAQETSSQLYRAVVWKRSAEPTFNFTLNKTTVAGQNSVQGTVTLDQTSPSALVFTTYDNSSLVNTPATVTVAANTLVKNFQITVTAVNSPINTTLYCKRGSVTQSRPLTLAPLVPTALAFTPSQVTGGQSTSCRIVINGVAGPGGRTIAVFDNSPNATTPGTVVVPAGATQVIFPISTTAVTSLKTVAVTARVSAGEKTGTFRINP